MIQFLHASGLSIALAVLPPGQGPPERTNAAALSREVLVLYATGPSSQIAVIGERELPRLLSTRLGQTVDYYSEYLDSGRFSNPRYQQAFLAFLRLKYREHRISVIVLIGEIDPEFTTRIRAELFPAAQIVYFLRNPVVPRIANATGLVRAWNLGGTIALALALERDTNQVFVVSGAADTDRASEARARRQLAPFETRLAITYLSGLPTSELEQRLATLPRRSIVLYLLVYQDGRGERFQPLDYLDRLARVANRPIYSWVDSTIDHGVIAGRMLRQGADVEAIAALVLRLLRGERADAIPISVVDASVSLVDWRQLRRWQISEDRVPAGTVVLYRQPGLWDRYKTSIGGAAALLLIQSALIASLLIQASRRRRAEARVRASEERFRVWSNAPLVMFWSSAPDKGCVDFNQAWLDFTGRTIEAEAGYGWFEGVHPDDRGRCLSTSGRAFDRRGQFRTEYRLRRHDGEYRWILDIGVPAIAPGGVINGFIGSAIDVTDLKLAREMLSSLSRRLMEAQERERTWVARELHDDVGQQLALLAMKLQRLGLESDRRTPTSDLHGELDALSDDFSELARSVQGLSHRLHSSKLDLLGIAGAARVLCTELTTQHAVTIDVTGNVPDDLPRDVALGLFRVLQESLNNAVKHSRAQRYSVELWTDGVGVHLEVADNGIGFDVDRATRGPGLGLISMRERLALINGRFSIESAPGEGTRIRVSVPLPGVHQVSAKNSGP